MANAGFKGDRLRIAELTIQGGIGDSVILRCQVQFCGEEGAVHAIANHRFTLDAAVNDDLVRAARELLSGTIKRVEALHFRQPNDAQGEVLRGIAETLRAGAEAQNDEPGTQG